MYYLHVTITCEFDVPEPDTVDTPVGVDTNEGNVALTALDRETVRAKGALVLDYRRVKQEPTLPRHHYSLSGTRQDEHLSETRRLGFD